jgi:hypothetical protein
LGDVVFSLPQLPFLILFHAFRFHLRVHSRITCTTIVK